MYKYDYLNLSFDEIVGLNSGDFKCYCSYCINHGIEVDCRLKEARRRYRIKSVKFKKVRQYKFVTNRASYNYEELRNNDELVISLSARDFNKYCRYLDRRGLSVKDEIIEARRKRLGHYDYGKLSIDEIKGLDGNSFQHYKRYAKRNDIIVPDEVFEYRSKMRLNHDYEHLTDEEVLELDNNDFGSFIRYCDIHGIDRNNIIVERQKAVKRRSRFEKEVYDEIIKFYDGPVICNDKKTLGGRKEIDIYLPELKVGIECNGIYWHGIDNKYRNKDYHYNKWKSAYDKGITLFQIWDFDWKVNNFEIVDALKGYILDDVRPIDVNFSKTDDNTYQMIFNKKWVYIKESELKQILMTFESCHKGAKIITTIDLDKDSLVTYWKNGFKILKFETGIRNSIRKMDYYSTGNAFLALQLI